MIPRANLWSTLAFIICRLQVDIFQRCIRAAQTRATQIQNMKKHWGTHSFRGEEGLKWFFHPMHKLRHILLACGVRALFFDTCTGTVYPMARLRVCVQQVQVEPSVPNHKAAKYRRLLNRRHVGRICRQEQFGSVPNLPRRLRRRREEWQPKPGGTAYPSKPKEQTESSVEPLGSFWSQSKGTPGWAWMFRSPCLAWLCATLLPGLPADQDRSL